MDEVSGIPQMGGALAKSSFTPVLTEKLKQEKLNITTRLEDINAALKILEKNPEIARAMDAVSKLHLRY